MRNDSRDVSDGVSTSRRRLIAAASGALLVPGMSACATIDPGRVQHTFFIMVAKGSTVRNLRYLYGDLKWREKPLAEPGPISSLSLVMSVPEEFEISWESEAGARHAFRIPVRAKLPGSVAGKTVRFVIAGDHVEGYLGTPNGYLPEKLERFH